MDVHDVLFGLPSNGVSVPVLIGESKRLKNILRSPGEETLLHEVLGVDHVHPMVSGFFEFHLSLVVLEDLDALFEQKVSGVLGGQMFHEVFLAVLFLFHGDGGFGQVFPEKCEIGFYLVGVLVVPIDLRYDDFLRGRRRLRT